MAEKLQDKYIYSLKPHPGLLAVSPIDEDFIRKSLREALKITKANNCHIEIIMKDNHTLANKSENAVRWSQIAMEEAYSI
jgi:3-methyladenine DNA glycosylase AlkD